MTRPIAILVASCVAACVGLVAYKVAYLDYSFVAPASENRWSVQVSVEGEGHGARARIHLSLPSGEAVSRISDERFASPGMKLAIRAKTRVATFTSDAATTQGRVGVQYRFSVRTPLPGEPAPEPPNPQETDAQPSEWVPSDAAEIGRIVREIAPIGGDETARLRAFYDFAVDELAASREEGPSDDRALDVLSSRKGSPLGRARVLVAFCRATGLHARVVRRVSAREGIGRPPAASAEVFVDGSWLTVDPSKEAFGESAVDGILLMRGDGDLARIEGLDGARVTVSVTRESVNEWELVHRRTAGALGLIDRFSLLTLPPQSQLSFRVLLLVPLGALIVAVFRNMVGVPTFGTFMPILVALALRETTPLAGFLMLLTVLGVGTAGRVALDRLRLLLVPRLALLLTLVIFIMAAVAVVASSVGETGGLSVALLPMVIITMTIERLTIVVAEEGWRTAVRTALGTALVTAVGYLAIQSDALQRVVFTFPELNLLVVAALLLVGRYTGYRLSELGRFRALDPVQK